MDRTIEINGVKYVKQAADFKRQTEAVVDLLGLDMLEALSEARAILAGGAVLSNFTHGEVNDLDVYFRSKELLTKAFVKVTENFNSVYLGHTNKSITLKDRDTDTIIQFIYFEYFDNAEAVFEAFDFTACMAAVELNIEDKHELVLHPDFLSDVASRTLHFNRGTRFPYVSLVRTRKYAEKGFKLGKGNLLAIAAACATIPINSWEEAKYQLGGVYGYKIDLEVEQDTPFSQQAFHDVLTRIQDIQYTVNYHNYEEVYKELTGVDYYERNDVDIIF